MFVSFLTWLLGTEIGFSVGAVCDLKVEHSLQSFCFNCYFSDELGCHLHILI